MFIFPSSVHIFDQACLIRCFKMKKNRIYQKKKIVSFYKLFHKYRLLFVAYILPSFDQVVFSFIVYSEVMIYVWNSLPFS